MSTHCQAMSDWFELSIRYSVIYDEIIMTYHIHGSSPLCSTMDFISGCFSVTYFLFLLGASPQCTPLLTFRYLLRYDILDIIIE